MPSITRSGQHRIRAIVLCGLIVTPAFAQTTGFIHGLVTDEKGAPLAGAVILLGDGGPGTRGRGTVADKTGAFQIAGLPPAPDYSVRASLPGFATVTLSGVAVSAGKISAVHLTLYPETALREHVEVRASPGLIDLEETTTETRLDAEFIDALPLFGRNYQEILTLAPGVTDVDGDGNPNIHGARDTDVVTLVDGVSTTDPLTGKVGAQLNLESIQEIEIKTSGATAEFGRAQGGFATVITKSGGNEFEGAFKFIWRGSALDGNGAGIDDPRLHAGVGEAGLRDLRFNDYFPYLSFGGPLAKDRAWFFVTSEYIQKQEPVNALSAAFVRELREYREFAKLTWQATTTQRLTLSVNYDPQEFLNEGLNGFTRQETGYTTRAGGTVLTLKATSIMSPMAALETSLSNFDGRPALVPNLGRDTNGNGVLYYDRNRNGFPEASERDPGDDYDQDGVFDVFEDLNRNGILNTGEDRDGDGRLTILGGCEGDSREDLDCDGHLDNVNEDTNGDGYLYSCFCDLNEDLDHDLRLDPGTEDRNGNRVLDDAVRPAGPYPYGRLVP
ncbi:MAG: TonB-dependent receptor, partial [Acidobacteria bacterium]|nr:TonB-dependent receptor [Acidobacteriota bacterium]